MASRPPARRDERVVGVGIEQVAFVGIVQDVEQFGAVVRADADRRLRDALADRPDPASPVWRGAPGVLAPVYLEGTYSEIYANKGEDEEGLLQ